MKSLSTLLCFFIITVSVSLAVHHDHASDASHGFTVDLIHRDSPLSPFFNPTTSPSDRLRKGSDPYTTKIVHAQQCMHYQLVLCAVICLYLFCMDRNCCVRIHLRNAFLRSISQASRFSKKMAGGFTLKIEADGFVVPGEYIMKFQIGTPPVKVFGTVATGADIPWAQCQPCKNCYKQVGPILDPASSSTYKTLSCQSKGCKALDRQESSCNSKNKCQYKLLYLDESHSAGDLAIDTFWLGETPLKNIVFGCGHDNNGTFDDHVSGIVGFGGSPLSLISQVKSLIQGKFSYCLVPELSLSNHDQVSLNQTSKIHFGDHVNMSGPNVVSTPLVNKYPNSVFYYVTLLNAFVGNNNLSYTQQPISSKIHIEVGNIIVDSGKAASILPQDMYDHLTSGLINSMGGTITRNSYDEPELCYKDLNLDRVPKVTFRFDGADVEIPPANLFWEKEKGVSCLAIVPMDDFAVFGNYLQRNLMVGFDLVNWKVSFMPTDCTKH